jgi:hypothetical protein
MVGAAGIENNTGRNFKDLEEMRGNAKALKRNNRECKGILIGPSMAPRFFASMIFLCGGFFAHCPRYKVGFGPKFRGADGKPKLRGIVTRFTLVRTGPVLP